MTISIETIANRGVPHTYTGTATTVAAEVEFDNTTGWIQILNKSVEVDLYVSLDGGTTYTTIFPLGSTPVFSACFLDSVYVKTLSSTAGYDINTGEES